MERKLLEKLDLWSKSTVYCEPYTWAPGDSTAEVDFLVEGMRDIIPIEAKAERNLQAKSLGVYRSKFAPRIVVRTSLADQRKSGGILDLPLYAVGPGMHRLAHTEDEEGCTI